MSRLIERIAHGLAVLGGLVLTALVLLVFVSVLGRSLNTLGNSGWLTDALPGVAAWVIGTGVGPVLGDFEIVEAGIAFAIFCFLPICQLYSGHATVDVFTDLLPRPMTPYLKALWEIVLTAVLILIAVQLFHGTVEKMHRGQTTFLLQFPVWWGFGASFIAALAAALVGLYCSLGRVYEALTGRPVLPGSEGAVH